MKKIETKFLPFELKAADEGIVEGYASTFGNVDSYKDTVVKGAFAESIVARKPKMLADHDMRARAGVWDEMREDDRGLYVKGRINLEKQLGREIYSDIKMGSLDGLSIGYRTTKDEMDGDIRRLLKVDLFEVSFVTMPADANAKLTGVKSLVTVRDWERFLRDEGGLSNTQAKAFCAEGFAALAALRDEADEGIEPVAELATMFASFGR